MEGRVGHSSFVYRAGGPRRHQDGSNRISAMGNSPDRHWQDLTTAEFADIDREDISFQEYDDNDPERAEREIAFGNIRGLFVEIVPEPLTLRSMTIRTHTKRSKTKIESWHSFLYGQPV